MSAILILKLERIKLRREMCYQAKFQPGMVAKDWEYNPVVEHLGNMHKALGSIPQTGEEKKTERS